MRTYTDLRTANADRQQLWDTKGVLDGAYRGNELAGETGEACNIIKKLERERHGIGGSRATVAELAEEIADVVICADLIALHYGFDLDAAVRAKWNASSAKLGFEMELIASKNDANKWLGEILAVIHQDGGHYRGKHGNEKATKDAIDIYLHGRPKQHGNSIDGGPSLG